MKKTDYNSFYNITRIICNMRQLRHKIQKSKSFSSKTKLSYHFESGARRVHKQHSAPPWFYPQKV